MKNIIDYFVV